MADLAQDDLKRLVDQTFADLGIAPSTTPLRSRPARFRNCHLLFVDDSREIFKIFVPPLIALTQGCASFLRCWEGSPEDAAQKISERHPHVALVDGQLGGVLRGWDVVAALQRINTGLPCIGFSSDPEFERNFLRCGAVGFVYKDIEKVEQTLDRLESEIKGVLS